jgi:hypothetical protein
MLATDLSPLAGVERGELVIDTGATYDGVTPVLVHVTKRDRRYEVSDGGGAVAAAGVGVGGLAFDDRIPIDDRYDVNVSRKGVVGIPIGPRNATPAWIEKVVELVAEGSRTLYQALLESD